VEEINTKQIELQKTPANERKMATASQPVIVSFLTSREEGNNSAANKS
jgi:hypothetical protein